jgi:hypothetical protein
LQGLLGLPTPSYLHVAVVTNANGEKLSKQTGALAFDRGDNDLLHEALLPAARFLACSSALQAICMNSGSRQRCFGQKNCILVCSSALYFDSYLTLIIHHAHIQHPATQSDRHRSAHHRSCFQYSMGLVLSWSERYRRQPDLPAHMISGDMQQKIWAESGYEGSLNQSH